jgi:hypothetical protein
MRVFVLLAPSELGGRYTHESWGVQFSRAEKLLQQFSEPSPVFPPHRILSKSGTRSHFTKVCTFWDDGRRRCLQWSRSIRTLQSAAQFETSLLQDWLGLRKRTSERYLVISEASLVAVRWVPQCVYDPCAKRCLF